MGKTSVAVGAEHYTPQRFPDFLSVLTGILEQGVRFLEKPVLAGVLLNSVRSVLDEPQP
jgi:hypothetical protein